jgi:hypothetical protein
MAGKKSILVLLLILAFAWASQPEQLEDLSSLSSQLAEQDASLPQEATALVEEKASEEAASESEDAVEEEEEEEEEESEEESEEEESEETAEEPVLAEADASAASESEVDERTSSLSEQMSAYKRAIAELKNKITAGEQTVMDELARIDVCPAGQVASLMAKAKNDIQSLQRVQALYVALRQQEAKLSALLKQRGVKTDVKAHPVKPTARAALKKAFDKVAGKAAPKKSTNSLAKAAKGAPITDASTLKDCNANMKQALSKMSAFAARLDKAEAGIAANTQRNKATSTTLVGQHSQLAKIEKKMAEISTQLRKLVARVMPEALPKSAAKPTKKAGTLSKLIKKPAAGKAVAAKPTKKAGVVSKVAKPSKKNAKNAKAVVPSKGKAVKKPKFPKIKKCKLDKKTGKKICKMVQAPCYRNKRTGKITCPGHIGCRRSMKTGRIVCKRKAGSKKRCFKSKKTGKLVCRRSRRRCYKNKKTGKLVCRRSRRRCYKNKKTGKLVCPRRNNKLQRKLKRMAKNQKKVLKATKASAAAAARAAAAAKLAIKKAKQFASAKAIAAAKAAAAKAAATRKALRKNLKKAKALKPKTRVQREKWADIVRQSRKLLKRTVRIKDLLSRQLAQYQDTNDVEGRKFNGWASIWDYIKGIKPAKYWSDRSKEIERDVRSIMSPAESRAAAESAYSGVAQLLKAADDTFATKFTKKMGNPALPLLMSGPTKEDYTLPPIKGAKIRVIQNDPTSPNKPEHATGVSWSELENIPDDPQGLSPVYVSQYRHPHKQVKAKQALPEYDPKWRYPRVPYSYPVRVVEHDPKKGNPHIKTPKQIKTLERAPETWDPPLNKKLTPGSTSETPRRRAVVKMVEHDPTTNNKVLTAAKHDHIEPEYRM